VAGHGDPERLLEVTEIGKKFKTCESCGKVFVCHEDGCWCDALKLTHPTIEALRMKYRDCLCEECLKALVTS
jgi:Cysteine-rich CWC